ncbi:substrate-binding domain-containing protein [Chloroflexota bacterium]
MLGIYLSHAGQNPLYLQIVEQLKQLIATEKISAGERLPAIRQLAQSLQINPGTVVKAYQVLEQQGIVMSRRGGGTVVASGAENPQISMLRRSRLSNIVSSSILEALSLGYNSDELEAAFSLHLAYWQEERDSNKRTPVAGKRKQPVKRKNLRIIGSHDLALNLLVERLKRRDPEINIEVTSSGSLNGLIALLEGTADMAGIHLLDEETGEYNYPYVKRILPGREVAVLHLAYRIQGLMFAGENPRQIKDLGDLRRPDVIMVNRQKNSGTRVLLDLTLHEMGINPGEIKGYGEEVATHMAVAGHIARGMADVGLGIEAAARSYSLGFLPLFRERYDLVIPMERYQCESVIALLDIVKSDEFKRVVTGMGGYDTSETGAITLIK